MSEEETCMTCKFGVFRKGVATVFYINHSLVQSGTHDEMICQRYPEYKRTSQNYLCGEYIRSI